MKNLELNKRAAKLIGMTSSSDEWFSNLPEIIMFSLGRSHGGIVNVREMKFTTSEDWFKLLLDKMKELEEVTCDKNKFGPLDDFIQKTTNGYGGTAEFPVYSSFITYYETPLIDRVRIVVEVLEAYDG